MNNNKTADGKLPKAKDLYAEIEELNKKKEQLLAKNKETSEELKRWENVYYNRYGKYRDDNAR